MKAVFDEHDQLLLAAHSNVESILTNLAACGNYEVQRALAGRKVLAPAIRKQLVNRNDAVIQGMVASRSDLTVEEMHSLSLPHRWLRARVDLATNPGIPEEVMRVLAEDQDSHVRSALIEQRRLSAYVVERIVERGEAHNLYQLVMRHFAACAPHLVALSLSPDELVRNALGQRLPPHQWTPVLGARYSRDFHWRDFATWTVEQGGDRDVVGALSANWVGDAASLVEASRLVCR